MELKRLIKLQNAVIRAHQKIKDVQVNNSNQNKEIKNEFKKEIDILNKTLEQLSKELNSFTKKEELNNQNKELGRLKRTLDELNDSLDKRISEIQLTPGKDGKDGLNGMPGRDGYTPVKGKDYFDGKDGVNGKDGANGLSAYEIAVKQGFEGTEEEWINRITNSGGKSYTRQLTAINQRINELAGSINPDEVLTKTSVLDTIEECEQCEGEQVPSARLMAMTYNTIPRVVSEVENDVGYIAEETDPVFTNSVAYNITTNDINNWNDKATKEEVEKVTPKEYYIKVNTDIVLEETDITYAKISKDIEENRPFVCRLEYGIQTFDMQLMRISEFEGVGYYEFMSIVRNGINQLIFWFYIREDETTQIELVTDAPMVFHAELNPDGTINTLDATYVEILHAMNSGKDVLLKATWQGETIHMSLGEWKAGYNPKYFSFYGMVRNGLEVMEFFIHIGENGQHTFSDVRTYQMKDEKVQSVIANSTNQATYPSTFAIFNEFMRKPDIIYSDPTGFEATNDGVDGTWYLTGLDLSKYKRLKFYVSASGSSNDNYTPSHIVEMHLDDRAKKYKDAYTAGHASQNPNNRNRIHFVSFAVSGDKTAIQFIHAMSLYGTAGSDSSGGRTCYLIEGYYD